MNNNDWWDAMEKSAVEDASTPDVVFDRLEALGIIDERGEVTGHLIRWDANFAILAVQRAADRTRIELFHCMRPHLSMVGGPRLDLSRSALVDRLKKGFKVITVRWDDRLELWKHGCEVRLSPNGFIRCDADGDGADDVGDLPEQIPASARR